MVGWGDLNLQKKLHVWVGERPRRMLVARETFHTVSASLCFGQARDRGVIYACCSSRIFMVLGLANVTTMVCLPIVKGFTIVSKA